MMIDSVPPKGLGRLIHKQGIQMQKASKQATTKWQYPRDAEQHRDRAIRTDGVNFNVNDAESAHPQFGVGLKNGRYCYEELNASLVFQ
jgi:hypothetical protein